MWCVKALITRWLTWLEKPSNARELVVVPLAQSEELLLVLLLVAAAVRIQRCRRGLCLYRRESGLRRRGCDVVVGCAVWSISA